MLRQFSADSFGGSILVSGAFMVCASSPTSPIACCRSRSGRPVRTYGLPNGSGVARGDQVLDLRLWNEHLTSIQSTSVGLVRATALPVDPRVVLRTRRLHRGGAFTRPPRSAASACSPGPAGAIPKLLRIASAYGFDTVDGLTAILSGDRSMISGKLAHLVSGMDLQSGRGEWRRAGAAAVRTLDFAACLCRTVRATSDGSRNQGQRWRTGEGGWRSA